MPAVIALIAAVADNGAIGASGGIPWRLATDMRAFRRRTMGKPLIMGRRTFTSLPAPLDGRDSIVITGDPGFVAPGAAVAHSFAEALVLAEDLAARSGAGEVMVIGGSGVYRAALPHAARLYLTRVHTVVDGDTWFPTLDWSEWREMSREPHRAGPKDDHDFTFLVLERRTAAPAAEH